MEGDGTIKSPSDPWQFREESVLSDHFLMVGVLVSRLCLGLRISLSNSCSLHLSFPFLSS